MIDARIRLPENAPGKYFVTGACNGCGLCFSYAMQNIAYNNDATLYYVIRQPENSREEQDLLDAMSLCPLGCILEEPDPHAH